MTRERRYFVGLDLGQASDFTALAVLDRPVIQPNQSPAAQRPAYRLGHLQRFPLGTPYPAIVRSVVELLQTPPLPGCTLVVDQTGVGRPVVEMLQEGLRRCDRCRMVPVTITAGQATTAGVGTGFRVPKKELVGALQALLQTQRLQIARSLPEARLLVRELEGYRVRITSANHEAFGAAREGEHDDLVLAAALAAWRGERDRAPAGPTPDGRERR